MFISKLAFALVCLGSVSAAESTLTEKTFSSFRLRKHTETPNPQDHNTFETWILSQHPSSAKKALLTSTITSTHYPFTPSITWYKAHLSSTDFEKLLTQTYPSSSVIISSVQSNYDYTPNGAFWVDFANAKHFGGGFRSKGNVQEERMFDEFPQLADLAYVLRDNDTILPTTSTGAAEPFLIVSALRKFDVSKVPYGSALDATPSKKVKSEIVRLKQPFKSANIIGLAAKDYSKKHHSKYSINDLKYHLQAALLGDLAALQYNGQTNLIIHTGRWGAGAFENSLKMITALQILAAEIAFSEITNPPQLIFHGIAPSLITSIQQEIVLGLQAGTTPAALLNRFKDRQNHDSSWSPQN